MREVVAITLGFFSGTLVYMVAAILLAVRDGSPYQILVAVGCFVVGTIVSASWMLRGTPRVSLVFRKGFLLGTAEWIVIITAVFLVKARNPDLRVGIIAAISATLALICLIGYAVAMLVGRGRKSPDREGAALI
jgi:hypothetical protein